MKKIIFLLILATGLQSSGFAKEPVSQLVLTSFHQTFQQAKEVSWTVNKNYFKAEFVYNSQYITAYYDFSGKLMGITKNILSTQLPILLETNLKENYSQYWIADVVEYSGEEETTYYVTVENGNEQIILKSAMNYWSVVKKIKK